MDKKELIKLADDMRNMAHAPYSGYTVGAALLAKNGNVYTGCNIENAAYSATNCAERTAFFKAVSEGVKEFECIAIAAGPRGQASLGGTPCGVCRQVMLEFCDDDFKVMILKGDEVETYDLNELIPHGFSPKDLN